MNAGNPVAGQQSKQRIVLAVDVKQEVARRSSPRSGVNIRRRNRMTLSTILLILFVLLLVGALPTWGYSRSWGYAPSGALGLIVVIIIVLLLMGRI